MSNTYDNYPAVTPEYDGITAATTTDDQASGKADIAKEQAGQLKSSATDAGKQVAGTAKGEVKNVASEAKNQAKDLLGQTKTQLSDQAGTQQKRAASGIRSIGDELKSMAEKSETNGPVKEIVHQVASRADGVANWLDDRDPTSLLSEVSRFARQRPGTFIAIAAITGLVAGRLTRSLVSEAKDAKEANDTPATSADSAYLTEPTVAPATYTDGATYSDGAIGTAGYDTAAPGYATTDDFSSAGDYVGTGATGSPDAPLSVGNDPYRSNSQP